MAETAPFRKMRRVKHFSALTPKRDQIPLIDKVKEKHFRRTRRSKARRDRRTRRQTLAAAIKVKGRLQKVLPVLGVIPQLNSNTLASLQTKLALRGKTVTKHEIPGKLAA